ncbi:MAG: hypothetical protein ACE5FD_11590, partial [Anaerolineae bacterium]
MKKNPDRLYDLLPLIYRQQDVEQGWPLKALLRVAAEQLHIVEEDIDRLYQNWFIETCDDWVVPYIAELVGYEPVHEAGQPGEVKTRQGQRRNKILIPRRDVANTIRNRRRKGTLALLEELARDVADWPARAVEFFTLLSVTQSINHLHLQRGRTADLSDDDALSRLNGPFDEMAHTLDIRRPNSQRTHGRYNIPSIGLFVWRLRSFPVTKTQAYLVESKGASLCYTFSALNNDIQLFTHVTPESDATQIAAELDLPVPIRRQALQKNRDFYYG